ncbi:MAG: substrate-binding domain-containing protein [Chloroflexi bacterium]|nr:substrate-binding domain-containing protein [Chloroflexota bacterium]
MVITHNSTRERKTIGVFVSKLGRVWGPEFIVGITAAAEANNLNVICFVGGKPISIIAPGNLQPSYGFYDIARTEQLAGIIVSGDLGYELDAREIKQFFENYSHIPLIVNAIRLDGIPNLIGDNLCGMRTVVSHLFDTHAYKKIAFIRGPENQLEAEQRFLAYKQELDAHHTPFDEMLVLPGDFSIESGRTAVNILLDERKIKVDAIVAANDRMAIGAYEALQLRGVRIPASIALTGFDDVREARSMGVPLTTVRQSFYDMGQQAVDLLLQRINGEILAETIIAPTQFVVRWSCGCLPESVQNVVVKQNGINRDGSFETKRDTVIAHLMQAADMSAASPLAEAFGQAAGRTWETLLVALRVENQAESFLNNIETLIAVLIQHNDEPACWQNVVSGLRQQLIVGISERNMLLRADDLFQQARVMAGELAQRQLALQRIGFDQQEEILLAFSAAVAPAMSLDEIGTALKRYFPALGVERMYVMLYSSMVTPQSTLVPPSDNYHLLMQYDDNGFYVPVDRPKWATGHLIPHGKTPENRRYSAIVMPLLLAQNRFGFMWIEVNAREWEVYVRIRNLISSALLRTMLVEQRTLMQKQVEHLLQESQLREMELANATETAESTAEENARLYTNELERREDAEMLSKVARNLSTLLKMEELPNQILTQLSQLLPYERGALLMEASEGPIQILAHSGFPENAGPADLLGQIDSDGTYNRISQSGEPVIIEDVASSANWKPVDWLPVNHSWLGVPLFSKNKVIGMLSITRQAAADFSHDDLLLVMTYGMQAAISLENARLYGELTRFNESLERLVAQRVEELNIAYNKLEKLDKNKSSFIQVTAHELRTPLTVMKGYLGMLKGNPAVKDNESLLLAVDGVYKGADRLHMIVNSMLDVVRLDGQIITPRLETVIIGLIFQLIQKEYKNEMAERNIALLYEDGIPNLPFIQADPELLQKALDAIIVNAIKYTPDGGSISLGGQVVADEQLGPCLEIHVRDTGIGIDPANQQIIFEKLLQLGKVELHSSGRTKFKGGGPGLGLAIAAGIVKAHAGKIWVESPGCNEEEFPGSTFFIRLPMPKSP